MTKIRALFPDEQNFSKVEAAFFRVADARGISREEALRQAMLDWIRSESESVEVTLEEWKLLAPFLEEMRRRQ